MSKEYIDTCYICNELHVVSRHYQELMCNTCYNLILRIRKRIPGMTRDEFLTAAITRRAELKGSGKWESNSRDKVKGIHITIIK